MRIAFDSGKVWESATNFLEAYRLGRAEADAATNLMAHVPPEVVQTLSRFVRSDRSKRRSFAIRTYGMNRVLHHEPISAGMFNLNYSSACSSPWENAMQNTLELLNLTCEGMEGDFLAQHVRMRRPYGGKDIVAQMTRLA